MKKNSIRIVESLEVAENWALAKAEPMFYSYGVTALVLCKCNRIAIRVFAKDQQFTQWTCAACLSTVGLPAPVSSDSGQSPFMKGESK